MVSWERIYFRACWRHQSHRRGRKRTSSPSSPLEQAFEILTGGHHKGFAVDSPESAQAKASHPMPLLGFGKERLNPDFPLAHRFLIRCSLVIGAHTLGILFPQVTMDRPAMGAGRTLAFQRAAITCFCLCSIDPYIYHMPRVVVRKLFPLRTGIDVLLCVIEKLIYSQ